MNPQAQVEQAACLLHDLSVLELRVRQAETKLEGRRDP
eukprot:CAMPEP_0175696108 /NCGR_PEP_ID=MMETSP0097-20121207/32777_1 /TAXON_ID=311494 /ORGANISM="Alexandrium monilatum, Strain CCMP3105" /LENGTH=37 /DNA_ID= /DNA_START= /DNA_END= /DNA_ORIENTATION=